MKTINSISDVISEKIQKIVNNRFAVVVLTKITSRKQQYGVQYWTKEMIEKVNSINIDNTNSKFIQYV